MKNNIIKTELNFINSRVRDRLIKLNNNAQNQTEVLKNNKNIKDLELLQQQIIKEERMLIK